MTDDDRQLVTFKVDEETYEIAKGKLQHGELSEELRTRLDQIAYGTQTTKREQLREELQSYREKKRELDNEIGQLRKERDEVNRKIERVEDQLDTLRDRDGEYNGALEMIESRLHDGKRIHPKHDLVDQAAQVGDKTSSDVIDDLMERNPDVPTCAFELASPDEPTDWRNKENSP